MRVRFLLLGLLGGLVACGFQPGTYQVAGGGDGLASDAPVTADDSDGDSIVNEDDNCPSVSNIDQRDHDSDARGDLCDLCPHLDTGSFDPDDDLDGVGNACDPRPATPGDKVVLFEGFYDPASISTWTGVGLWSVSGGRLVQTSETADVATMTPAISGGVARHAVTTSVRADTLGTINGLYIPGVAVAGGVSTGHGYYCVINDNGSDRVRIYGYWTDMNAIVNASADTSWSGTFANGSEVTLRGSIVGAEHRCSVSQGVTMVPLTEAHGPTDGVVRLVTSRMAASFDYVFVVAVGS